MQFLWDVVVAQLSSEEQSKVLRFVMGEGPGSDFSFNIETSNGPTDAPPLSPDP